MSDATGRAVACGHENRGRLDAMFRRDPFAARLGFRLDDWGGGWAQVSWTVDPAADSFIGMTHGGAVFSLGDAAFGFSSNSWGRICLAVSVDVQFLQAVRSGETVTAMARERVRNRRTGAYLIELTGHDGRLVGSLHALVYRTEGWHFGSDAWSPSWREGH